MGKGFQHISFNILNGKTLPTATTAARIWVVEIKSFAIQSIAEIKFGIDEIKKAFQITNQGNAFVFKNLVHGLFLIVEIHFVRQAAATPTHYAYPQKVIRVVSDSGLRHKGINFLFCFVAYGYRVVYCYTHI